MMTKLKDVGNFQRQIGSEVPPVKAGSIEDLATALGIKPSALKATIEEFNAAVQEGDFTPVVPDGKRTRGIAPPKSNWARTIEGPEFMAYPLVCTNVFTFGGIRVSPKAQVVNTDGYVIPGLYAAGEVIGLYYESYVTSTSYLQRDSVRTHCRQGCRQPLLGQRRAYFCRCGFPARAYASQTIAFLWRTYIDIA